MTQKYIPIAAQIRELRRVFSFKVMARITEVPAYTLKAQCYEYKHGMRFQDAANRILALHDELKAKGWI